jgi:hypothetical protein
MSKYVTGRNESIIIAIKIMRLLKTLVHCIDVHVIFAKDQIKTTIRCNAFHHDSG